MSLLHDFAGETYAATARRLGSTRDATLRRAAEHGAALDRDSVYRRILCELGRPALAAEHRQGPVLRTVGDTGKGTRCRRNDKRA